MIGEHLTGRGVDHVIQQVSYRGWARAGLPTGRRQETQPCASGQKSRRIQIPSFARVCVCGVCVFLLTGWACQAGSAWADSASPCGPPAERFCCRTPSPSRSSASVSGACWETWGGREDDTGCVNMTKR